MAVELLSVARAAAAPKRAPVEEAAPAPAAVEAVPVEPTPQSAYVPTSEYEAAPQAEPEPQFSPAETVSSYEAQPVESGSLMDSGVAEEATTPVYEETEPASVASEEPAPEWTSAHVEEAPAAAPRRRYGQDAELPVEVLGDEERRLHNDARRFARLLISEIKLYNEQKVVEGRIEHDLYDRLREYIDRSREMYDKRVKSEVAGRYDYFHSELVNTLAEGDVSKLGANYPGATVNA
jgi:hypothetical protein